MWSSVFFMPLLYIRQMVCPFYVVKCLMGLMTGYAFWVLVLTFRGLSLLVRFIGFAGYDFNSRSMVRGSFFVTIALYGLRVVVEFVWFKSRGWTGSLCHCNMY